MSKILIIKGGNKDTFPIKDKGFSWMPIKVNGVSYLPFDAENRLKYLGINYEVLDVDTTPFKVSDFIFLPKWSILYNLQFHSKTPRKLNTVVDVYFTFKDGNEEHILGVRFQDWNIFITLTDEQCEEKLRKYLIDNNEIKHPAKPLEI